MANYLGTKLSRLVRRRAYLGGDIIRLDARVVELRNSLAAAEKAAQDAKEELQALDGEIETLSEIDVTDIRAIRATPRTTEGRHGQFVRELVRVLREADSPVDTEDLVAHMASTFSVPISTREQRKCAEDMVRRRLNELREDSAVIRLPSAPGKRTGIWRWIAD